MKKYLVVFKYKTLTRRGMENRVCSVNKLSEAEITLLHQNIAKAVTQKYQEAGVSVIITNMIPLEED